MLFLEAAKQRDEIQQRIKTDLNKLHNVRHEFIEEVFLEMEISEDGEWRQESGLLVGATRTVSPEGAKRIWDDGFRVFLSHKSEVKKGSCSA